MTTSRPWSTVGFLLFDGFEVLDLHGPMEMFGLLIPDGKLEASGILTVAAHAGLAVASAQGPATVAQHGFDDCPPLDVLVVPGGRGTRTEVGNAALLDFLRRRHAAQKPPLQCLLSVCTGAALIAAAGLLDGRRATTNKRAFDWVASTGAGAQWVREARWVCDGNITTAAGVSAGMDAALHLIQRQFGQECAASVARRAEYSGDFQNAGNDPFGRQLGLSSR